MNILGKIRMFSALHFVNNEEKTVEERSPDTQNVRGFLLSNFPSRIYIL